MNSERPVIDILLATYNGEKYIKQQIDSIINQSYTNWNLIIRDDGSTDRTLEIINQYITTFPGKVHLLCDHEKNLGPSGNFSRLLEGSKADYTMFCDQDDVWKDSKIEITFQKMKALEGSKLVPVLIHTDLKVVDTNLRTIADSMFSFQKLNKNFATINYLLVQNNITGCTMMINKKLRDISKPIPEEVIMHDWWIALVAVAFGKIGFVDYPTIQYRQHGANDTGAKRYSIDLMKRMKSVKKMYQIVNKNIVQANCFYERYKTSLDEQTKEVVSQYISLLDYSPIKRLFILKNRGYHKQGTLRDLGFKFILSTLKK